jgi:hypothetical protein
MQNSITTQDYFSTNFNADPELKSDPTRASGGKNLCMQTKKWSDDFFNESTSCKILKKCTVVYKA